MITSTLPSHLADKIRRLAGPNPEGSKLTDMEHVHLVYQLTALNAALMGSTHLAHGTAQQISVQLEERGMSAEEISDVLDRHRFDPVAQAGAIAVHPSLQHPYLD